MYPLVARRALGRRLEALSRNLPFALQGDVEAVHRARVASRRLREILAVLRPEKRLGHRKAWRKAARRARRVTQALGGVRELDVALGLLDELLANHPPATSAVVLAKAVVTDELAARREEMRRLFGDIELDRFARRLEALLSVAGERVPGGSMFGLRARVEANADRLSAAVADAGALFAMDRLHAVRIAAKKLRYTLELVDELLRVGARRAIGRLRAVQDVLGRMHDLDVLNGHVRRAGAPDPGADDVRELVALIDTEMHALHAAYVARTRALVAVVEECRGNLLNRIDARAARRQRIPAPRAEGVHA